MLLYLILPFQFIIFHFLVFICPFFFIYFLVRAGLRSLYCDKPVRVKFVNHSGKEVQLYWINYVGECEKAFKILDGKCEVIDTYETHPWIAANARNKKVHHAFTIGNNLVYYPILGPGGRKYTVAEIRKAPGNINFQFTLGVIRQFIWVYFDFDRRNVGETHFGSG